MKKILLGKNYKRLLLFLMSVPMALLCNYFVVMYLLDYVNYFGEAGYIVSLVIQVFVWFEILIFFFDRWNTADKIMVVVVYYFLFLFCLLARPVQGNVAVNLNPIRIIDQFTSFSDVVIGVFNVGAFVLLVIVNGLFISKMKTNIGWCIVLAFLIEAVQVILHRGIFDICDIILYGVGIGGGVVFHRIMRNKL